MDPKIFLDNRDDVHCCACKTRFNDLKQLQCLHRVCSRCLNEIQRASGGLGVITCPCCRTEQLRDTGIENVSGGASNSRITSSPDRLAVTECKESELKCENCDKRSPQNHYCFQCCLFWCGDCLKGHNMIKRNREHRTLLLKLCQDNVMLERPAFCQKKNHGRQELKFFCSDCKVEICKACASADHKGHDMKLQEEATNKRELQKKTAIKSLKQKALLKRNELTKLDKSSMEINAQLSDVKSRVQTTADQMTAIIDAQKQHIFNTADSQAKEFLERLALNKSEVESQVKMIESAIEKIETVFKKSSNVKIQGFDEIADTIYQEQDAQSNHNPERLPRFGFTESKNLHTVLNNEGIGRLETDMQHANAERNENREVSTGGQPCAGPLEAQVKTKQFRIVLSFGQQGAYEGMLKCPWGLAVNDNNEILVTELSNHRVSVFSSDRNYLRSFGKFAQLYHPTGIAYNNGKILVASRDNHKIQMYSNKGKYLKEFVGLDQQLKNPCGLSVDADGNVIVADTGNRVIKIFSSSGEILTAFGTECSFVDPYHCIQHQKHFVVSDWGDHCIKIYDPNGNFLYKIGKEGVRDGEFNHPSLLSVSKEGHLVVCDSGNDRVQVFDLRHGEFVAKFGSEGSNTGEFNRPMSTAILDNGRIAVSDNENHRIQIFDSI